MILLNVGMGDTNNTKADRFPAIPAASQHTEYTEDMTNPVENGSFLQLYQLP